MASMMLRVRNWLSRLTRRDRSKSTYVNLRTLNYGYLRKEEMALQKGVLGTLSRDVSLPDIYKEVKNGVTNVVADQMDLKYIPKIHEETPSPVKVELLDGATSHETPLSAQEERLTAKGIEETPSPDKVELLDGATSHETPLSAQEERLTAKEIEETPSPDKVELLDGATSHETPLSAQEERLTAKEIEETPSPDKVELLDGVTSHETPLSAQEERLKAKGIEEIPSLVKVELLDGATSYETPLSAQEERLTAKEIEETPSPDKVELLDGATSHETPLYAQEERLTAKEIEETPSPDKVELLDGATSHETPLSAQEERLKAKGIEETPSPDKVELLDGATSHETPLYAQEERLTAKGIEETPSPDKVELLDATTLHETPLSAQEERLTPKEIEETPLPDKVELLDATTLHETPLSAQVEEEVPEPPSRTTVMKRAIDILHSERGYCRIKSIGSGAYGDVYRMKDPVLNDMIAAKLILKKEVSKSEIEIWPTLNHKNIMPLLEILTLHTLEVQIFLMPLQAVSLFKIVQRKEFKANPNSLNIFKDWLRNILNGIQYLHDLNLCHLDIKASNVVISSEPEIAIICDFTFLKKSTETLKSRDVGQPDMLRPPEACFSLGRQALVKGKECDMWGFGVMVLDISSDFAVNDIEEVRNWKLDVHPIISKALKKKVLRTSLKKAFPKVEIEKKELKRTVKFLRCFLKTDPSKRISASTALKHKYLGNNTVPGKKNFFTKK